MGENQTEVLPNEVLSTEIVQLDENVSVLNKLNNVGRRNLKGPEMNRVIREILNVPK